MSGLFDRLIDQPGDEDDNNPGGLTPLDMADLPPLQRQIMFTLLRDKEAASSGITQKALAEKLDHPDGLTETLDEMTGSDWLLMLGEPPDVRYKANLRRKRPRGAGSGLWSSITSRLSDDSDPSPGEPTLPPDPDTPEPPSDPPPAPRDPTPGSRRPPFP